MDYRIFPTPRGNLCTPFVYDEPKRAYARYVCVGRSARRALVYIRRDGTSTEAKGASRVILGRQKPNREIVLSYLLRQKGVNPAFRDYVRNVAVIPTFPESGVESLVKTIIRQVIIASHAQSLFSAFVKRFGYCRHGIYGFPSGERLARITMEDLLQLGLGFKAERILEGVKVIGGQTQVNVEGIKGIGLWSARVFAVEVNRDYSLYPFDDKSGERIHTVCGINLMHVAARNSALAGDLYVYGASYLGAAT